MSKGMIDERASVETEAPEQSSEEEVRQLSARLDRLQASLDLWGQAPDNGATAAPSNKDAGGAGFFIAILLFIIGAVAGIFFRDQLPDFIPVSFQKLQDGTSPQQGGYLDDSQFEPDVAPARVNTPASPESGPSGTMVAEPVSTGTEAVAEIEKAVVDAQMATAQLHPVRPMMGAAVVSPPFRKPREPADETPVAAPKPAPAPEPKPEILTDSTATPAATLRSASPPRTAERTPAAVARTPAPPPAPAPVQRKPAETSSTGEPVRSEPAKKPVTPKAAPKPPTLLETIRARAQARREAVMAQSVAAATPARATQTPAETSASATSTVQPVNGYVGL